MIILRSFGYGHPGGVQHPGEETEDEFAQRIWEEMQRRKQPAAGPTAATQEAWGAADEAAKQRDVSLSLLKLVHSSCIIFAPQH